MLWYMKNRNYLSYIHMHMLVVFILSVPFSSLIFYHIMFEKIHQ